jgi:spermidine/putrescine transport system ATP-binding protein
VGGGEIRLVGLVKRFEDVTAVDGIDLDVPGGEFFALLGPSGCGKTTTLRLVAGFEQPTDGRILLDGTDMARTPPHKRRVNTVFQSYALFPFLSVADNVAFGLRFQDVDKNETRRRVAEALALVQLQGLERRRPAQLSGGQQQRVALARALEEAVGITFVYVTHDQEEALTMSDRLAVMAGGRIEQVGPPAELYDEPASTYVAGFLGVANLFTATASGRDGGGSCRVRLGEFELEAAGGDTGASGEVRVVIRPERVRLEDYGTTGPNRVPGMVERLVYQGPATQLVVRLANGEPLQALVQNQGQPISWQQGTAIAVHLPADALRVLPESA